MLPLLSSPLPLLLNSFVGREQECATVERLLATQRLVTLTGSAGIGKTRLGVAVAAALSQEKEIDYHFVALHTLQDPQSIVPRIAQAIGIRTPAEQPVQELLQDYLVNTHLLLVLDGFDHVIEAAPSLLNLLSSCPHLQILVTSRTVLQLYGEQMFCVRPLALPKPGERPSIADLTQFAAIALFIDRAQAVNPNFALTEENAAAVVQLCQRLDGIPSAIEMAAANIRAMSVRQIDADVANSLQLLTNQSRSALSHHKSFQESINWSYDLLTDMEKQLFCRLAGLTAPFALEDVEASCTEEGIMQRAVFDQLSNLVNKSMVLAEERDSVMVYRLLETYRRVALIKLGETDKALPASNGRRIPATRAPADNPNVSLQPEKRAEGGTFTQTVQPAGLSPLRIFALGSIQVYRGEYAVTASDWKYAKSRELLYYLLCNGTSTKGEIALKLWPDASPNQMHNNMRTTLHHLRRALGDPKRILFENGTYVFNAMSDYWFDVASFESHLEAAQRTLAGHRGRQREHERWSELDPQRSALAIHSLEAAASLYQGEFLTGLAGEWFLIRQEELRRKYLETLIDLGALLCATACYRQAGKIYHQILAQDNYLEVAHRGLMRCYLYQGERVCALRHYQVVVDLMDRELSVPPAPETTALFERIRRGEEI